MTIDALTQMPQAILFDLDGTLADTAPDLIAAIHLLEVSHGRATTPYVELRPVASAGARGLIGVAFGMEPDHPSFEFLKQEFLANYAAGIADKSTLFDGIALMLRDLSARNILWGIVTNKVSRLTEALIPKIGLQQAGCVVSGDTTPYAKPHPEPLLEAARRLGQPPAKCWYVGDDLRDIQAGQAAGMPTLAAAWGYCGKTAPEFWAADAIIASPLKLLDQLDRCR